jgi:hypothetical protein
LEMFSRLLSFTHRFDEAEAALRRALSIKQKHFGAEHPNAAAVAQQLEEVTAAGIAAASKRRHVGKTVGGAASVAAAVSTRESMPGRSGLLARLFGRKP